MRKSTHDHVAAASDLAISTFSDWPIWRYTVPFPSTLLMGATGTPELEKFLAVGSAWAQVLGHVMPERARLLDIGCGCGKIARFFVRDPRVVSYFGFDPIVEGIDWSNRYIAPQASGRFQFEYVDLHPHEYNPNGRIDADSYTFAMNDNSVELAFAASLFTHLLEPAAQRYLQECARVLTVGGILMLSLHIEPAPGSKYSGSEARIDVDVDYFLSMANRAGLRLKEQLGPLCGQEALLLVK